MNRFRTVLFALAAAGLAAGIALPFAGYGPQGALVLSLSAAMVLAVLLRDIAVSLAKGETGLDIVAALSIGAALAFGESLAAAVVALMYSGGQLLEGVAAERAQSSMRALLARAPKTALRYDDGQLIEVAIDAIRPGDRLLVRQGDMVAVDGHLLSGRALIDRSALSGESVPVTVMAGERVESGGRSLDMAFDMVAERPAAESAYAAIVRLVKEAQARKAPMVRLADRHALWFLAVTVALAGGTYAVTGDHLRMLAVLVSATPCPLILAVPVAIVSGMGKAARRGVLMKGGPVVETMARATGLVIDKTGTLTHGRTELVDTLAAPGIAPEELLRLAASLEQASAHVTAASIVAAARRDGLALSVPTAVRETAGEGLKGVVDGRAVAVGGVGFIGRVLRRKRLARPRTSPGTILAGVAVAGRLAGYLVLADTPRAEAPAMLARLRRAGISRIVLASGDTQAVVDQVGAGLGFDRLLGGLSPSDKVAVIMAERKDHVVMMAGDGVNDAPALASADVGIALGVSGSAAAAQSADAVLLVDDISRLAEAVETARRARTIALQSLFAGLGLSLAVMIAAAFGHVSVVQGALAQEAIDVAVILNALRALR